MSRPMFSHAYGPGGMSVSHSSVDDRIRPGLRVAYPLPDDDGDSRFKELLGMLAQRTGHADQPRGQSRG